MSLSPPTTRADCPVSRPCPHTACRYHLSDLTKGPNRPTCSFDIAEHQGPMTFVEMAWWTGQSRQNLERIFRLAMAKFEPLVKEIA